MITTIKEWCGDRKYDIQEKKRVESVKEDGKYVKVEFRAENKLNDYTMLAFKIVVDLSECSDTVVNIGHKRRRLTQGSVSVSIDGMVETDYEGRWERQPFFIFLRGVFDKYVYKTLTGKNEAKLRKDADSLKRNIAKYLNMYKTD